MFETEEDAIRAAEWVRNNRDDPRAGQVIQMLRDWDSNRGQNTTAAGQPERQAASTAPAITRDPDAPPELDTEGNWIGFQEESQEEKGDRRKAQYWRNMRKAFLTPIGDVAGGVVGSAEMGLAVGTGAAQAVAGGLAGTAQAFPALTSGITYADVAEAANMAVETTLAQFVYEPKTDAGRAIMQGAGEAMQDVDTFLKDSSEKLAMGDPETATVIYTALNMLPTSVGAPVRVAGRRAVTRDVRAVEDSLADRGIYLGDSNIRDQIQNAADESIGIHRRGENMSAIRRSLSEAEQAARQASDDAFAQARAGDARIQAIRLRQLHDNAQRIYESNDPNLVPKVNIFVEKINEMIPPVRDNKGKFLPVRDKFVSLREMDNLRRQINNAFTKNKKDPENRALLSLKTMMDEWIEKQHNADLIEGDPVNVQEWAAARKSWFDYNQRFNENRVIRQLMDEDASVEDLRKFVFGLSETGSKTEAAQVVNRLKEILGPDDPSIAGLRAEFMLDIFQPLLRKQDFGGFVQRYDRVLKNNPSLVEALDIPRSDLQLLVSTARAVHKTKAGLSITSASLGDLPKIFSRILLGNRLAKATLRQNLLANVLRSTIGRGDASANQVLMEILGYDVKTSVIPKASRNAQAVIAAELGDYYNEEEESE